METGENKSAFERHFQTVIQAIIIILVGWFGQRTMDTSDVVIRLDQQTIAIQKSLEELKKNNAGQYTARDAQSDRTMYQYRFDSLLASVKISRKENNDRISQQWVVIRELEDKVESLHRGPSGMGNMDME